MELSTKGEFAFQKVVHKDLTFVPLYSRKFIDDRVQDTADLISLTYKDKNPVFIGLLNGAFIFLSDLIQKLTIHNFQIEFVKVTSYSGTTSTEKIKQLIGLKSDIKGRDIIIVDDIIDTGITMSHICNYFKEKEPSSIAVCTAVWKQPNLQTNIRIDYPAIILKHDLFVLGYGMDFDEFGRNLREIYILEKDLKKFQVVEPEFQYKDVTYKGVQFIPYISRQKIDERVTQVAKQISKNYIDKRPIFIGILNGAFVFMTDLVQKLTIYNFQIEFVKLETTQIDEEGKVKNEFIGLQGNIENRDVIIVDDIIDTGVTMEKILNSLLQLKPSSIAVCAAIWQSQKLQTDINVDYPCIVLEQDPFIVGYGVDFDQNGRNLREIYCMDNSQN